MVNNSPYCGIASILYESGWYVLVTFLLWRYYASHLQAERTRCYPLAHHGQWVINSEGGRHLTQMCPVSSHVLLFSLQMQDCYSEAPEFNAQLRQCTDFYFHTVILACLPNIKLRIWRIWGFLPEPMLNHCSPLPPFTLVTVNSAL